MIIIASSASSHGDTGIMLLCFALLCIALICFALLRFALLCIALHCFNLLCIALLCIALLCFVWHCFAFLCCCFALLCFAEHETTSSTALWKAAVYLAHQAEGRPESIPKICLTMFSITTSDVSAFLSPLIFQETSDAGPSKW